MAGHQTPRAGNRHPGKSIAPYNVYEASDGYFAIICIREGHWRKLADAMGAPELGEDRRFATMADRAANMDELDAVVNAWSRQHTRAELFAITQKYGVISAPVQSLDDVTRDPHMQARGSLRHRPHDGFGEIAQMQTPLRFADLDPPALTDPPALGDANDTVYRDLADVGPEEMESLRRAGAIGD